MTKLTSRVVSIAGHKTSMRLAQSEWVAMDDICEREHIKRRKLLELIVENKDPKLGMTAAVRLFIITYFHQLIFSSGLIRPAREEYKNVLKTINAML